MFKTAVVFCAFVGLAWSQSTPVSQCLHHNAPLPIETEIEGCSSPPCQLPQLQDAVLNFKFRTPYKVNLMRTVATAYVLDIIGIPYDLGEQSLTCNFLTNASCPVQQEQVVAYTLRMYIEPFFPVGTSVTIEFRINDENNSPITCIRVPVTIVAPLTSVSASPQLQ